MDLNLLLHSKPSRFGQRQVIFILADLYGFESAHYDPDKLNGGYTPR